MKTKHQIDEAVFSLVHFLGKASDNELPDDIFEALSKMLIIEGINERPSLPITETFNYIEKCKKWDEDGIPGPEFTKLYDRIEATYTNPFESNLLHLFVELALEEKQAEYTKKSHYREINGLYQY